MQLIMCQLQAGSIGNCVTSLIYQYITIIILHTVMNFCSSITQAHRSYTRYSMPIIPNSQGCGPLGWLHRQVLSSFYLSEDVCIWKAVFYADIRQLYRQSNLMLSDWQKHLPTNCLHISVVLPSQFYFFIGVRGKPGNETYTTHLCSHALGWE